MAETVQRRRVKTTGRTQCIVVDILFGGYVGMPLEVDGESMDEVCFMAGKHFVDGMPLTHDELVGNTHLGQYQVEYLNIVT